MNKKNCAFTICSKNYLAQAFTLKESFIKHNTDKDFYIFLADKIDSSVKRWDEVVQLSEEFIPKWEEMAFKYNVIEFNTSIKPFCFQKLFCTGYENVIYLDPDIYVLDSFDVVYNDLNNKDMVVTPHCTHIQDEFTGAVSEEELLFVGIYNLGFCGIKNSAVGNTIINWWMNRLEKRCFVDKIDALHVDQKWIDFLPAFFPNELLVSHHLGYNVAVWNLFERELVVENSKFFVKDIFSGELFPLIFFHFSGFDPERKDVINRRHPKYNVSIYPSFIPLIQDYAKQEFKNNYEYYTYLKYDFNNYSNGNKILPFHRRIYDELKDRKLLQCPFDCNQDFYKLLKKKRLLSKIYNDNTAVYRQSVNNKGKKLHVLKKMMQLIERFLKGDKYQLLLNALADISRNKNQGFLI